MIVNRPIVFDREFSYRGVLNSLVESVNFVIRLNMGANPPLFYYDAERNIACGYWLPRSTSL